MPQETTSMEWNLDTMNTPTSGLEKAYLLLLLIIVVVAAIKLVKVWRVAPPFRASQQNNNPAYLHLLRSFAASLQNWIVLTFLAWGLYISITVTRICGQLQRSVSPQLVSYIVGELSVTTTMALLVALFAFLVRWHISRRLFLSTPE